MKLIKAWLPALALFCQIMMLSLPARADALGRVLIFINPQEYIYEHKIGGVGSGPFSVFWFKQGPLVEPIAKESLRSVFADAQMCEAGMTADTIIWIRPSLIYNDQMTNFYGGIEALVYAGNGEFITAFNGLAAQSGFWDVFPEEKIKLAYQAAMQQVTEKIRNDTQVQGLIQQGLAADKTKIPCSMVSLLPPKK